MDSIFKDTGKFVIKTSLLVLALTPILIMLGLAGVNDSWAAIGITIFALWFYRLYWFLDGKI